MCSGHCCCAIAQIATKDAEIERLKRIIDRLENSLDLVPNPGVTPGQPRPHHRCTCGGRGHE